MESNESPRPGTPEEARAALDALQADRAALADRIASPWWYHPVLAAIMAAFVASPAAPVPALFITGGSVGLIFLVQAQEQRSGLSVTRPAGPRSRAVLFGYGAVAVALVFVSFALVNLDLRAWVAATAGLAFALMLGGGLVYDRVYGAELRNAG
ncbi:hypothetical protein [Nocardiopsis potens]|uniref:hypothetical protein n=1 Tax=Nocardiopsis potens TaxID=1246458 RepID=UPI0003480A34|nr:hypothetical protein [Nocardiopsis potens]